MSKSLKKKINLLRLAVIDGDYKKAKAKFTENPKLIYEADEFGYTPLYYAIASGQHHIAAMFVKHKSYGDDPRQRSDMVDAYYAYLLKGGITEKFYKDRLWFSVNHFNSADKLKDGWE